MNSRYKTLLRIAPPVLLLDQASKWLISRWLPEGGLFPVLPNFFDLVHTRNPGAAFGSFSHLPDAIRLPFFFIASGVALVAILLYYVKLEETRSAVFVALALIVGGAMGNILDRICRGKVVDFLSFHWYQRWVDFSLGGWNYRFKLEWPAFNLADAAITIGVAFLTLFMLKRGPEKN